MSHSIVRADNAWRFDPVDGAWTLVALNRRTLPPLVVRRPEAEEALLAQLGCAFCGPLETRALDRLHRGPFEVVALPSPTPLCFVEHQPPEATPFAMNGALGAHELLVPVGEKAHGASLTGLGESGLSAMLTLLARRASDLRRDVRLLRLSLSFLPAPLARLPHTHAALLAAPFTARHAAERAVCPLCQDLEAARATGRVLVESSGFVAFVPHAPKTTLHVRVAATEHLGVSSFAPLERLETAAAAGALARVVLQVALALEALVPGAGVAFAMPALPLSEEARGAHALFELFVPEGADDALARAHGTRITTLPPEELAGMLRARVARSLPPAA